MDLQTVPHPDNLIAFREGTRRLAVENGYPVLTADGTFVADARAAWLIEAIEQAQVALQIPRHDPGWFHASSLGGTDADLLASYSGLATREVFDARKLRVFDLGHDRDRSIKRYIQEAGIAIAPDGHREMVLPWLRLRGECDEIVYDPSGRLCIVENKTKAQHLFAKLNAPDEGHVLQVHAYMGGLGIHQSIILYEAKNDQHWKAFYVPFEPGTWDNIVARLRRLRRLAEENATEQSKSDT